MNTKCRRFTAGAAANALSIPPGSTAARLKLKGIDGGPHKRWSMWFNSTQREEPYQAGHAGSRRVKAQRGSNTILLRCCMAVVSSCREVLG